MVPAIREVVGLTLVVSGIATFLGVALGLAVGAGRFRGRGLVTVAVNTGMAMPPVLAGMVLLLLC